MNNKKLYYNETALWNGKLAFSYGIQEHGWVLLSIMSTAFNRSHIVSVSDVFSPFDDIYTWLTILIGGNDGNLFINEEGIYTAIQARYINKKFVEVVIKRTDEEVENWNIENCSIAGIFDPIQIANNFKLSTLSFLKSCPQINDDYERECFSGWSRDFLLIDKYNKLKIAQQGDAPETGSSE